LPEELLETPRMNEYLDEFLDVEELEDDRNEGISPITNDP
jgi:hypothetical protein